MQSSSKNIFSEVVLQSIKTQGISTKLVRQLVEKPDREQIVNIRKDLSLNFIIKHFPSFGIYILGVVNANKNSLDDIYTLFPSLMNDIDSAEPYEIFKTFVRSYGLPFLIRDQEELYIEYAEKYFDSVEESDNIEIIRGNLPDDTSFFANIGIKKDIIEDRVRLSISNAFVINATEYLHWLHEERIERNDNVRIILPEGHMFPPSAPFDDVKSKLADLRSSGTISIGLSLIPLLMTQNRFYSTLFCYKYKRFELALFIERSVNLIFQHFDIDFNHLRQATISLRSLPLADRSGEIRVTWSREKTSLMIIGSGRNLIAKGDAS